MGASPPAGLLIPHRIMKQASWVTNPSSRAIIAAIAALLAVSCVILVLAADEQEIVASGVQSQENLSKRLARAVAKIGKHQKAPHTENIQVVKDAQGSEGNGGKNPHYGIWKAQDVQKWSTLKNNLVDLKAFADVAKDAILDMNDHDNGILKDVLVLVQETPRAKLVEAWRKFVDKTEHKYTLSNSLVRNMLIDLDNKLSKDSKGILEVRGAKVVITGKAVGLEETPENWKTSLVASLHKVLDESKLMHKHAPVSPKKKGDNSLTQKDFNAMFKVKCINLQAKNNFSMGCDQKTDEKSCRKQPGCLWNKGWDGNFAETTAAPMPYDEVPVAPEEQAEDEMDENEDY